VSDALERAGSIGPFSVLLLIVAGSGVMGALRHTINEAWDIHERPPLLRRKALDLALILGATIVLALSLAVTATRKAANVLDDEEGGGLLAVLLDLLGDVLPFVFTGGVILFLYCVLPVHRQRPKDVWPGVVVAVLLLALLREGLELYFEHLADFGALYGSLGALMALLLFVYAAAMVLLFGAEFASEWTRLPPRDEVSRECLRPEISDPQSIASSSEEGASMGAVQDLGRGINFYDQVRRFEIDLIRRALEQTGGHQSRAARLLGMNATTLNSKIKTYRISLRP